MIVSAPKIYQEDITVIDYFVWQLNVSWRVLNTVTDVFSFPIPCCQEGVEDFGNSNGPIFCMKLDNYQGCHQISVREKDRCKLAFFTPDGGKNFLKFYLLNLKSHQNITPRWWGIFKLNEIFYLVTIP